MATYLKSRHCPKPQHGKKAKELRWVTTCLSSEPTENATPKYTDWEVCASLFASIDILTHNDGVRYFGFDGHTLGTAKGLLVLLAYAVQYLHKTWTTDPTTDPSAIEDLAHSFSFSEI